VCHSTNQTLSTGGRRRLGTALRALALATAVLALAATTAAARPAPIGPPPGDPTGNQTIVRVIAPTNGFAWGDAAIGAAAGLAISLVAVGGALSVTRRREHQVGASGGAIG
jgi:hypothetical protein